MSYIFEHFFGIQIEYGTLQFWKEIKYRARFREPTNLKYPITVSAEGNVTRVDEGTIDDELKFGERLGQCIWAEIKWSGETKLGEN